MATLIPAGKPFDTVEEVAKFLRTANYQNRPIIPIVGSGISAGSGFPVLASIIRYFGKLRTLLEHGLWLPSKNTPSAEAPLEKRKSDYKDEPWKYVQDFAWPDRFQLTEDLLFAIERNNRDGHPEMALGTMSAAVGHGLDLLLEKGETGHMKSLKDLRDNVSKLLKKMSAASAIEKEIEQALHYREDGGSVAWDLCGDWRRMIHTFANFQDDQADALLTRFARDRSPNLAHRYLAFLVRRLGVPVVFTMNFDPFIEKALQEEGMTPQIFAMEHGLTLPDRALVREQLSVIKMHGSTHGLLLDENLDRPLGKDYLDRFRVIVPANAVFLVLGCSGNDRRLLDLIGAGRGNADEARKKGDIIGRTSVVWLHFEQKDQLPTSITELYKDDFLRPRRTKNLGGTLLHLYSEIDQLHPSSSSSYPIHFQQPVLLDRTTPDATEEKIDEKIGEALKKPHPFLLLETISRVTSTEPPATYPEPSASRQLLRIGTKLPAGFNLIWIDLESIHTLSAVAGSIIDQCRKYDPTLAPCVLPLDEDDSQEIVTLAVARTARALRRSRYYVAFDGLETYTWSPTAHHGDIHSAFWPQTKKLKGFTDFLLGLSNAFIGDSRFALSIDPPRPRSPQTLALGSSTTLYREMLQQLQQCVGELQGEADRLDVTFEDRPYDALLPAAIGNDLQSIHGWNTASKSYKSWPLALYVLATFRRTRPLALVYQTLRPILGDEVAAFLDKNQELNVFRQIEGGGIWFFRELRDYIYASNTRDTGVETMKKCCASDPTVPYGTAVFQLLLNSCTHQMAARAWYSEAFIQSQDTFALMEYLYHRLAGVRSLTKLLGLLSVELVQAPSADNAIAAAVQHFKDTVDTVPAEQKQELWEAFELKPNLLEPERKNLRDFLLKRHKQQLHRLRRAWQRSEKHLRAQVPAEQLLRWCEQFLNNDLEHRCHRLITGYGFTSANKHEPTGGDIPCLGPGLLEESGAIERLRNQVRDFTAKIRMDRSEYEKCRQHRKEELSIKKDWADLEKWEEPYQPRIRLLHHEIDRFVCDLREAQEDTIAVDKLAEKLGRIALETENWGERMKTLPQQAETPGLHEVQLRRLHVLSNCYLGRACVFSHEGFDGRTSALKDFNRDEAEKAIAAGSALARLQSQPLASSPRSTAVNPTADGTVYLQYRGIFLTQHARFLWMEKVNAGCKDPKELLDAFERALQEFERARAGLDANNNLTLALADLHAAEACLAHARIVLREDSPAMVLLDLGCEEFAHSRYERARGLLARARTALAGAQRNVVWWRLFFQLTAQYHSDRLLWYLLRPEVTKSANYLDRLRKGYQSLRNGFDLHLQDRGKKLKAKLAWLPRLGSELTVCGFILGVETWSLADPSRKVGTEIDDLGGKLNWLTETAGLGTVYNEAFSKDGGAYVKLLAERADLAAGGVPHRKLRQRVIACAADAPELDIDGIINPPLAKRP